MQGVQRDITTEDLIIDCIAPDVQLALTVPLVMLNPALPVPENKQPTRKEAQDAHIVTLVRFNFLQTSLFGFTVQ